MSSIAFDRVGDVVLSLGSQRFGGEYYRLFRDAFGIEACTVFAFRPEGAPTPLVAESDSPGRRRQAWHLACDYANGAFKHDPIIRANLRRTSNGRPIAFTLRADQVADVGYRRHFYDEPALQQKVGVLGHVDGTVYYANFYRGAARSAGNGNSELRLMREMGALAVNMLRRHHVAIGVPEVMTNEVAWSADWHRSALSHLQSILGNRSYGLSSREAEVCAHIVLGYSTLAIGLNLGVSVNTVATHRKRAYVKLGICSQNELFERYFTTVNKQLSEEGRSGKYE